MKRIKLYLTILLAILCLPIMLVGQYVQSAMCQDSSGSQAFVKCGFGSSVTTGNTIVVYDGWSGASGGAFVKDSDNKNNSFTILQRSPGYDSTRIAYAVNITGGADTVWAKVTSSNARNFVAIAEYQASTVASGVSNVDTATVSNPYQTTSGNVTPPVANCIIVGGLTNLYFNGGNMTAGTNLSFTVRQSWNGATLPWFGLEDATDAGTSAVDAEFNATSGNNGVLYSSSVVVLKPTGGGGGGSSQGWIRH